MSADGVPPDKCRLDKWFWRAVERLGVQPAAVLHHANVPVALPHDSHHFVTTAQFFAIFEALEDMTGDPAVWLQFVTATIDAGIPAWYLAASYAPNYRDGLSRVARFKGYCMPEQVHLEEKGGEVLIYKTWFYATTPEPSALVDSSFAFLVALARQGTGQFITPVRVDYARPGPSRDLHRSHFGCPIRHDAPRNQLVMRAADFDLPFPGHNAELLDILTPALTAVFDRRRHGGSIAELTKVVLMRNLSQGRPDVAMVARELGTSERTLQRRITADGKTFRSLLIEARRDLGRRLLSDPSLTIGNVAVLLGYQDTTSFYRAFRSWEGVTPNRWRDLNANNEIES